MIKTPILKLWTWGNWNTASEKWGFCAATVQKYFNIPKTATHLQFVAYKENGPGRTRIEIVSSEYSIVGVCDDLKVENSRRIFMDCDCIASIKKKTGKVRIWYVEAYYWEHATSQG